MTDTNCIYGARMLFWVFALMFIFALMGLASMFLLPGGKAEQYSYRKTTEESDQSESAQIEPEITAIG